MMNNLYVEQGTVSGTLVCVQCAGAQLTLTRDHSLYALTVQIGLKVKHPV
jgi:hypothetical protein